MFWIYALDLVYCLTDLLFFWYSILFIYYVNVTCCLFSGDKYISFGISISTVFLKNLLLYQQVYYQLNHQLPLLFHQLFFFWISLLEAVFIASVVNFFSAIEIFLPYVLTIFITYVFINIFGKSQKSIDFYICSIFEFNGITHFYNSFIIQ